MVDTAQKSNGSLKTQSVADYIVHRLALEGVSHCFGVAGDYAFPLCDAVDRSAEIQWIGCANELNAAYAADGYARIRGAAMLVTTYGVGELSALNGVMGAKAEHSLVFHLVGMPSYQNQRLHKIAHHTLGDGQFGNFVNISAQAACCHAVISPENCMVEMERLIAEARRHNQPAYIAVPSDFALAPVVHSEVEPAKPESNAQLLGQAIAAIEKKLEDAKSVVVMPAFAIARIGLQKEAQKLIETLGWPFATTSMEKGLIGEAHPQFAGVYAGAVSNPETRELVEGADVILDLGGVNFNDISTASYSAKIDPNRVISIGINDVQVGQRIFGSVRLADMISALAGVKRRPEPYHRKADQTARLVRDPSERVSMAALYPRYADFLQAGDTIVLETGSSSLGIAPMALPDGVRVESQVLWGSIGWATAAALGIAIADPERRTVLITGEGSHQLTANEIGTMGRFGANVTIFVLNNDGYMIERALDENPDWSYNDLAKWNYADLPRTFGCANWFSAHVETMGELDAAMKQARESKSGAYVEIVGGRMDLPPALAFAHTRLSEMYGTAPSQVN